MFSLRSGVALLALLLLSHSVQAQLSMPVDWSMLAPSDTVTRCPYKGLATDWWSAGDVADVAWSYPEPSLSLHAIAGLVCFDETKVTSLAAVRASGRGPRPR